MSMEDEGQALVPVLALPQVAGAPVVGALEVVPDQAAGAILLVLDQQVKLRDILA